MYKLIHTGLSIRLLATILAGLMVFSVIRYIFRKTKSFDKKMLKNTLRIGVCGLVFFCYVYFLIFRSVYPFYVASYEFRNNLFDERVGVIEEIDHITKEKIYITVGGLEYLMLKTQDNPIVIVGEDIKVGDRVVVKFGKNSKFIFDIYRAH